MNSKGGGLVGWFRPGIRGTGNSMTGAALRAPQRICVGHEVALLTGPGIVASSGFPRAANVRLESNTVGQAGAHLCPCPGYSEEPRFTRVPGTSGPRRYTGPGYTWVAGGPRPGPRCSRLMRVFCSRTLSGSFGRSASRSQKRLSTVAAQVRLGSVPT